MYEGQEEILWEEEENLPEEKYKLRHEKVKHTKICWVK